MATATKTLVPPAPPPAVVVTLVLSDEEAQFLVDVLARVGGSSNNTRRMYQASISAALSKLGYKYVSLESHKNDLAGSISFYSSNASAAEAIKRERY